MASFSWQASRVARRGEARGVHSSAAAVTSVKVAHNNGHRHVGRWTGSDVRVELAAAAAAAVASCAHFEWQAGGNIGGQVKARCALRHS